MTRWKKHFYEDIKRKVEHADKEYNRYKMTDKTIYLQQAGNKLFSAVENYLMIKHKNRRMSYGDLFQMVKNNQNDRTLLQQAKQLHIFYYNGPLYMRLYEVESIFKDVRTKLKQRLRSK